MVEMKKESIIVLALLALMISGCSPYSGKTPADTVVSPLGDKISVTEGCLVYALPMTVFELDRQAWIMLLPGIPRNGVLPVSD